MTTLYDWLIAHAAQIAATMAAVNLLLRAVPADTWASLETGWPRVAHIARMMRAAGPDLVKTGKALWGIWTGKPWPLPEPERASVMPPLPIEPKKDGAK